MQKHIGLVLGSMAIVVGLSAAANAQTYHRYHNIEAREARQERRIDQGIRTGQLTQLEAKRLEVQHSRLDYLDDRLRASGGRLTYAERERLERDLNRSSSAIYRERHDRDRYYRP
ncbi:MAG: hypothetical protein ABJA02_00320 [Acidobacteriota bacterium]